MKHFGAGLFLIMAMLFATAVTQVHAQTVVTDSTGLVSTGTLYTYGIYTAGTIKGTDTVTSKTFSRQDFDSLFCVYALFSDAHDSIKITAKLYDSPDGINWHETRTLVSAADTTTWYYSEYYFSEIPKVYRIKIFGVTGNSYKTTFKLWLNVKRE